MPKRLYRCVKCHHYSFSKEKCPICKGLMESAHPAKFSPEDKYGKYRRALRMKV
ncbi:MAG: nucleolar RNA-binding Nop10p family protein [Candidatus Ranarchaeia archaeon]